jgi:hypothetical protein
VNDVAQPHKGDRVQIKLHLPTEVMRCVYLDRDRLDVSSNSQFLSDLLCYICGMPQLALEVGREEDQLELMAPDKHTPVDSTPAKPALSSGGEERMQMVRIPAVLSEFFTRELKNNGVSSKTRLAADLVCTHYGRPDLAKELHHREEQLTLQNTSAERRSAA